MLWSFSIVPLSCCFRFRFNESDGRIWAGVMAAALVNLFTSVVFSAFFGVFTTLAFGVFAIGLGDDELEGDKELEDDLEELELSDEDLRSPFFDGSFRPLDFDRFS